MVSVVIPLLLGREAFPECLKSVYSQTYDDLEVIIVESPHSPAYNRNRGSEKARGDYIFFLDSDTVLEPDCIERLVKSNPPFYAYGDFKRDGQERNAGKFRGERLRENNFISSMCLVRKEHFPGFDESLSSLEDWDLWLTYLDKGQEGTYVPGCLFDTPTTTDGVTGSHDYRSQAKEIKEKHGICSRIG